MSMKPIEPLLVSKRAAAVTLGLSLRSIDELIASKSLRSVRVGRRRLLRYADLERFSRCGSNRITKRKVWATGSNI